MKRRYPKAAVGIALTLGLSLFTVVPVLAAVANDTVAGATPVSIGTTITQDTLLADATDPISIDITVAPSVRVDRSGVVHMTGTVTCTPGQDGSGNVFELWGDITQRHGGLLIRGGYGNYSLAIPCDGIAHPWDAIAVGDNGIFGGGKAVTVALASSYGCTDECTIGYVQATVQLRRGGK